MSTSTEPRGCLSILFPFLRAPKPTNNVSSEAHGAQDTTKNSFPFRKKNSLLTPAEQSFYHILSSLLKNHYAIQLKVRLADILYVPRQQNRSEFYSHFNRIASRHVDFLICTPSTMQPLVAIELDDSSHERPHRRERDNFVDNAFQAAGLPLIHFRVRHTYNTREIAKRLSPHLDKISAFQETPPSHPQKKKKAANTPPQCPTCGVPMVLRTATKGNYRGRRFYVCPNYARCKQIIPVSDTNQEQ